MAAMRIIIAALLLAASTFALAEQRLCTLKPAAAYVVAPVVGKPLPPVTKRLTAGMPYVVVKEAPGWVLIRSDALQLWSMRSDFGASESCGGASGGRVGAKTVKAPHADPAQASASSCLCGSGNVCHGRRGGRYCIAPSGAKRYGV